MGVTSSDALRLMPEYLAHNERLSSKQTLRSDEDKEAGRVASAGQNQTRACRLTSRRA